MPVITENEVNIDDIKHSLKERNIEFNDNSIYIMPDAMSDEYDLMNDYTPDFFKGLKSRGVNVSVVKKGKHKYLALHSADIILPLIIGIPFAILANFLTDWIKEKSGNSKVILLKVITKKEDKYKEVIIKGMANEVIDILNNLKDE